MNQEEFEQQLEEAKNRCLQGLQHNEGLDKSDIKTWEKVETFLRRVYEYFNAKLEDSFFRKFADVTPYVNSSIDVLWRNEQLIVLINFKEDVNFYGCRKDSGLKVDAKFFSNYDGPVLVLLNLFDT